MTPRQHEILIGLRGYLRDNPGAVPTVSELCRAVGLRSKGAMHDYLCRLQDQGFLVFARASVGGGMKVSMTGKPVSAVEDYDIKRSALPVVVDALSREAEHAEVSRRLELGHTHREIARQLGRSTAYVSHVRAKLGLQVRTYLHVTSAEADEIRSRADAGENPTDIAKTMRLSSNAVAEHLAAARRDAA